MSIFDRLTRRRLPQAPAPVKRYYDIPEICYMGMTEGVDNVKDASTAMKISAVYRCIDILSKGVAQLPLEVKRNRGGWYTTDEGNDLNYLLAVKPNSRMSAFDFMRNLVAQMVTRGNAYVYPEGGMQSPTSLILLTAGSVRYDERANTYQVSDAVNGISGVFSAEEILHFRNLSTGGYTGVSTITYAAKVLAISANADQQNVNTFKKGGVVRGFVSGNSAATIGFGAVQDEQLGTVADNIENQISSGRDIFSLPGEMRFNQISLSPNDLQTLATKEFNVIEICRFFGVHPDKVFAQQSSNYKASEMSQVAFLTDTLQPYLRQIELEFQTKMISREDYGTLRIDFNIDSLMQTDLNTQAAYIEKTIATGVRTVNSWRKHLGQEPIEGGDEALVSANLLPIRSKKLWGETESASQNE